MLNFAVRKNMGKFAPLTKWARATRRFCATDFKSTDEGVIPKTSANICY